LENRMSAVDADVVILRALLEAGDSFVSGEALAHQLGLSRVAVWQQTEKLREQGFELEAVRSRGYRLKARPSVLNATLLKAQLPERHRQVAIHLLDSVDSTNDEAARRLSAGDPTPFVVISREQRRGRGRLGRFWHSERNGSLYLSFAFRPLLPPERMPTITLWIGANLCELIASYCRLSPRLKWPNDLLIDGRKAGGILTEARIDADQIRDLVVGLGLNVMPPTHGWPQDLQDRAIALAEATGAPIDVNRLAAALVGRVLTAYDTFHRGEHQGPFRDLWSRFDALRDRPVTLLLHGDERVSGVAEGIEPDGTLVLRRPNGRIERFRAGEVTVEKSAK
jgi:BirA family transcriptional regulator, biotin operon repressor / biotin---[acetyl-CoA-carboxylase] ligase